MREQDEEERFHPDRVAGGNSNRCHPGDNASSGFPESQAKSQIYPLARLQGQSSL